MQKAKLIFFKVIYYIHHRNQKIQTNTPNSLFLPLFINFKNVHQLVWTVLHWIVAYFVAMESIMWCRGTKNTRYFSSQEATTTYIYTWTCNSCPFIPLYENYTIFFQLFFSLFFPNFISKIIKLWLKLKQQYNKNIA